MRRPSFSPSYSRESVSFLGRPTCYACCRPLSYCVCHIVAPFTAHCNLLILQHPHEKRKYHSTTKLLTAAILNAQLVRGIEFSPAILPKGGRNTYLLYPRAEAADCGDVSLNEESTVVVIDGTWIEARKIVFRNPFLKQLPCLSFKAPLRSEYRIRRQPNAGCLSTIESVGHLLRINAAAHGQTDFVELYEGLFKGFARMIDQQLRHWPSRPIGQEIE